MPIAACDPPYLLADVTVFSGRIHIEREDGA